MPDLMGHHLSDSKGEEKDHKDVNHKADFLYTKARSVIIRPQDPADKFNVDGEVCLTSPWASFFGCDVTA
jgi:hypothetical protein